MATIFKTQRKRKDPVTGKKVFVFGPDGQPVMHPKWRTTILDHAGVRRTYTLTKNKLQSQKQADMIEMREKEIRNGIRVAPEKKVEKARRPFGEVFAEYMAWGRTQGGRRGLPWDDEHAYKKERDIILWREALGLEDIADAADILTKVEAECRKMFDEGKSGKTVSNRVQNLRAMLLWCKKRKYLQENPLEELGKFDIEPTFVRRAMTLDEFDLLLDSCATHRRLLYEVAACSGLRENELRQLTPDHLDLKNCGLRVDRRVDKGRLARVQPIPAALMERLTAFVASGEVKKLYARIYWNQGSRPDRKKPPENPLLYVPANSATMLKKDLEKAGIPFETAEGRLDFHALRTAYINFLLDVGANIKTTQSLARHATVEMTMNIYGRARQENSREAVELLGGMLLSDRCGQKLSNNSKQKYRISTEPPVSVEVDKIITSDEIGGYNEIYWCEREDLNPTDTKTGKVSYPGLQGAFAGQEVSYPGHLEGDAEAAECKNMTGNVKSWTPDVTSVTHKSTKRLQNIYKTSLALLAAILQTPDLKALFIAWQKTLTPGAKNQILALVKSAGKLSGNNAIAGHAQAGA